MRKAAGTNYIPGIREIHVWKNSKELEDKLFRELEEKQQKKDDFEIWMDTVGQAVTALAIIFGLLLLVVNIPRLLGWW